MLDDFWDNFLGVIIASLDLTNQTHDIYNIYIFFLFIIYLFIYCVIIEGSLEVKLPTIWTDEKQRWEESERREE
jgi:hypothetical protein